MAFGVGCLHQCISDLERQPYRKIFVITISALAEQIKTSLDPLLETGVNLQINTSIKQEPSLDDLEKVLGEAQEFEADAILGIGGGSVLDVAKVVAAQLENVQTLDQILGIDNLDRRSTFLACLPTTAGTGSEMSPNAIFIDARDNAKKAVISEYLVPDAVYIDPRLTTSVPPNITASTGIDALTHCLEAYANRFAHPITDRIALEGIALISQHLERAVHHGQDLEARTQLALGSMYGGMCLGPVNTAAIHALSYPLGTKYHIAHGLSNALLLPHVSKYNCTAAPKRYAAVALAMGATERDNDDKTAWAGIEKMFELLDKCGIPSHLSALNVDKASIPQMAESALEIQRLLKNNVRTIALHDAVAIYESAY